LLFFLLIAWFFSATAFAADTAPAEPPQPVVLDFGGYHFGQSPAANMVCFSGFCKSQAPGGDGRVTFPFSIYETPGAVSSVAGLMVINPRYTFWENRLFRVVFQVDCTPLETGECLDDIEKTLGREYDLTPLSATEVLQFTTNKHFILKEYVTGSSALIKIRSASFEDESHMPVVDIVDKGMADLVGSTLSPTFKPKKLDLQEFNRKP
jgi:hypothetical protein